MGKIRMSAAILAASTLLIGCEEKKDKPRTLYVRGTIEQIDLPNHTVKVRTFSDKRQSEMVHTVDVNDDTEIKINGAIARMEDVRVGETAEGWITVVKTDNQRRLIATRVEVERAEPLIAPSAKKQPAPSADQGQ